MVHFVRDRGREHPRSASRLLGFTIDTNRDLVGGFLTGPTCGPCRFQDPIPPPLLLGPSGRAACIVIVTLLELGPHGCCHVCSGRYCLARTRFYRANGRCVELRQPSAIVTANVSDGGRVTPIGGSQAKEDTHDMVLKSPVKWNPGAFGLIAASPPTAYEGLHIPDPNNQAESAW